jgi:hypothetical protein
MHHGQVRVFTFVGATQDACYDHIKSSIGECIRSFSGAAVRLIESLITLPWNGANRARLLEVCASDLQTVVIDLGLTQLLAPRHGNTSACIVLRALLTLMLEHDSAAVTTVVNSQTIQALCIHLSLGKEDTQVTTARIIGHLQHYFATTTSDVGGEVVRVLLRRIRTHAAYICTRVKKACLNALARIIANNDAMANEAIDAGMSPAMLGIICDTKTTVLLSHAVHAFLTLVAAISQTLALRIVADQASKCGMTALISMLSDESPPPLLLLTCLRRLCAASSVACIKLGTTAMPALLDSLFDGAMYELVKELCFRHGDSEILVATGVVKCLSIDNVDMRKNATRLIHHLHGRTARRVLVAHGVLAALVKNLSDPDVVVRDHTCTALRHVMTDLWSFGVGEALFAVDADVALMKLLSTKLDAAAAASVAECVFRIYAIAAGYGRERLVAHAKTYRIARALRRFSHSSNTNTRFRRTAEKLLSIFVPQHGAIDNFAPLFEMMKPFRAFPLPAHSCTICLADESGAVVCTPCLHFFHESCLRAWLFEEDSCPICKTPVLANIQKLLTRDCFMCD